MHDVVILTERRYINPKKSDSYIDNVLLEDELVSKALRKKGIHVIRKAWDDETFDWTTTKYGLFRATWDYFDRFPEFSNWLKSVSEKTQLINSKKLIDWNIDKHYMQDLSTKDVHIPRTLFIEPENKTTLNNSIQKAKETLGFIAEDFVLKPCIAGGARHTYKFHGREYEKYEPIFQELITQEAMMLQEFQKNIVAEGEISMMVFNGKFTHAILKIAKTGDFRVQDDYGGSVHKYNPTDEEIAFAEKVIQVTPELPLYARVDIFRDNEERLALAELEIFEPELWFRHHPEAADILASSIKDRFFQ
ncbi:MAG: hypothetical protein ABJN84_10555 [Flavobacteriaceae bacterium]